jgi:hypothetical protein
LGTDERVRWWAIPGRVSAQVRTVRALAIFVLIAAMAGIVAAIAPMALFVPATLIAIFMLGCSPSKKGKLPAPLRQRQPHMISPRRPRQRETWGLFLSAILVVAFLPVLVWQWRIPAPERPAATPAGTYRSDRLTCVIAGLAVVPVGVLVGWFSGSPESAGWGWLALVYGLGMWVLLWMVNGPYPLLKIAEFVLVLGWGERVRFLRLLEDAADRGLLRCDGACYAFRDEELRISLAALGQEVVNEHAREQERRSARAVVRSRIVRLGKRIRGALLRDSGAGTAVFGAAGAVIGLGPRHAWWLILILAVLAGVAGFIVGVIVASIVLELAIIYARWTLANVGTPSRRTRLLVLAIAAFAVAVLVAEAGDLLAGIAAFVLPAACVAACGLWACVLTVRMAIRYPGRWRSLIKPVPDVALIAATAAGLLALADRGLLTAQPAAGLLFPPAVWGSVLIWRAMGHSKRLMVKAGADITLSLLLGAVLVLFLVWLANVLDLPLHSVATLRDFLGSAGAAVDLPWWTWAGLFALFIASDLAFLRWPGRLEKTSDWFGRLRLVQVAGTSQRVLTGVHIGLLVIVLIGLAAPGTVVPALQRQLKAAYTVALQRELEAEGELTAYSAISADFSQVHAHVIVLADIAADIHDDDKPPPEDRDATNAEDHLAYSLGELQAQALDLQPSPSLAAEVRSAAQRGGSGDPASGTSGLNGQAGRVAEAEEKESEVHERVDQASELAAKLVASTISIPHIGDNEVYEIVREYLSGLIEGSRLKDMFAAWTERVPRARRPPDANEIVVPSPGELENAASDVLSSAESATGGDAYHASTENEPPIEAAVDMLGQAQSMEENGGSCAGCQTPGNQEIPNDQQDDPEEDHPVEP